MEKPNFMKMPSVPKIKNNLRYETLVVEVSPEMKSHTAVMMERLLSCDLDSMTTKQNICQLAQITAVYEIYKLKVELLKH
jgi:hypothetical protein